MKTRKTLLIAIGYILTLTFYMSCNDLVTNDLVDNKESSRQKPPRSRLIHKEGNLITEINTIISNIPKAGENNYQAPTSKLLFTWDNIISYILNHDFQKAASLAVYLKYELVRFKDTSGVQDRIYYVLKSKGNNYWGTYVYYPNYCRPLVIQSPHPLKDSKTGEQGIHVFKETKAQFFCLAGTHRCNSLNNSLCDGKTSVCNGDPKNPEKYRISDMSHNVNTAFQKTTELLLSKYSSTYFIQLHGFERKTKEEDENVVVDDPYVILSNGTNITPNQDYLSIFKNQLLNEDNSLTFKTAHLDLDWTRLTGTRNKQGRLINNSSNPCNTFAVNTTGRFFHIEQEKYKLRNTVNGWNKIARALENTFSCED